MSNIIIRKQCNQCKSRKLKCSRHSPCTFCQLAGLECVYEERKKYHRKNSKSAPKEKKEESKVIDLTKIDEDDIFININEDDLNFETSSFMDALMCSENPSSFICCNCGFDNKFGRPKRKRVVHDVSNSFSCVDDLLFEDVSDDLIDSFDFDKTLNGELDSYFDDDVFDV